MEENVIINKHHKNIGSYYREVYAKNASGHLLPTGFTQKSRWTVVTQLLRSGFANVLW